MLLPLFVRLLHDWVVGPRVVQIMTILDEVRVSFERALALSCAWVPRFSLLLAIGLLLAAVSLVRT